MKFTDPKARAILRSIKMPELKESLDSFPEEERYGKSDIQILRDEVDYYLELFEEDGNIFNGDLEEARHILKETKNGREIPLRLPSFTQKYSPARIDSAKQAVSEYRQLKRIAEKLRR